MDSTTLVGAGSTVGVLLGALFASWVTRRNAQDTTAISGFRDLTVSLQSQLNDQQREIRELQSRERKRNELARLHERWDRKVMQQLNLLTDEEIPEPPPLDIGGSQ